MMVSKEEAVAKATKIKLLAEAEANKQKLSREFLTLEAIKAVTNNTRMYLGPSIPKFIPEQGGQQVVLKAEATESPSKSYQK